MRMTAEVEFVDVDAIFSPTSGLLGGNFSFIERGDIVPLSRQLFISTVSAFLPLPYSFIGGLPFSEASITSFVDTD